MLSKSHKSILEVSVFLRNGGIFASYEDGNSSVSNFSLTIDISVGLFPIHLNTYVMCLRPLQIVHFLQCGDRLKTLESDIYRRQIMTTKVDPLVAWLI